MNFKVRVKLTGEGVIPSKTAQRQARSFQQTGNRFSVVSETVWAWLNHDIRWWDQYNVRWINHWTEVR
jgi:hypothetical protein